MLLRLSRCESRVLRNRDLENTPVYKRPRFYGYNGCPRDLNDHLYPYGLWGFRFTPRDFQGQETLPREVWPVSGNERFTITFLAHHLLRLSDEYIITAEFVFVFINIVFFIISLYRCYNLNAHEVH